MQLTVTVTVKLPTTPQQYTVLVQTLRQCNAACDRISAVAFATRTFRQYALHALTYHHVKAETRLNANHVVRAIAKVAHAYQRDRHTLRTFQPLGAIELDRDLLTWQVQAQTVSLNTVQGRQHLPFLCSSEQKARLQDRKGQTDLLLRDGVFYLACAVTVQETVAFTPCGVIGIDLGLVNIATDSEGHVYTSQQCSRCAHTERPNRPSQEVFCCRHCCLQSHADVNAAQVLEARVSLSTGPRFHLRALASRGGQADRL